jgi:hypothetical protein
LPQQHKLNRFPHLHHPGKMSSESTKGQVPDIYGQVHPVETPELIEQKLREFELELNKIPGSKKQDLLNAEKRCSKLCSDDFKLCFLRTEVFNADLAAVRYAAYWKMRVEMYGEERAFLPLTVDSLTEKEKDQLRMGAVNVIERDDGRNFVFIDPSNIDMKVYDRTCSLRAIMYVFHALLEDEEVSKRGLVFVGFPQNAKMSQTDKGLVRELSKAIKGCLPARLSAYHVCQPPFFFRAIFSVVVFFVGKRLKQRFLIHTGSEQTVLDDLQRKYSFKPEHLPAQIGGNFNPDPIAWISKRQAAGL